MMLFKEGDNSWAARCHLVDDMDLDIEVQLLSDRTAVIIYIADALCREGIVIHKQEDGDEVKLSAGGIVYWRGIIRDGTLKRSSRSRALPTEIHFADINKTIKLRYEA